MITIKEHVPLSSYTTFGIGGPARYFCEAKTENDVHEALLWARERGLPYFVLAGGSNILVPDEGIEALVIKMDLEKWSISGTVLEAEAGCNLLQTIRSVALLSLGGWEKLSGIPGTIGGAVRGNAGAFGPEMKDFLVWAYALNTHTLETHEFSNEECEFAYRMSFFKKQPEWIILKTHIQLRKTDTKDSVRAIEDTIKEREKRHIQNVRAAGSYFVNPVVSDQVRELFEKEKAMRSREGRVPAGWLIEKVGMKGARVGGAEASEQHPNYLMNAGGAKASDVRELAAKIKSAVREELGVELEEEAVVL